MKMFDFVKENAKRPRVGDKIWIGAAVTVIGLIAATFMCLAPYEWIYFLSHNVAPFRWLIGCLACAVFSIGVWIVSVSE